MVHQRRHPRITGCTRHSVLWRAEGPAGARGGWRFHGPRHSWHMRAENGAKKSRQRGQRPRVVAGALEPLGSVAKLGGSYLQARALMRNTSERTIFTVTSPNREHGERLLGGRISHHVKDHDAAVGKGVAAAVQPMLG